MKVIVALSSPDTWPNEAAAPVTYLGEWCFSKRSPLLMADIKDHNILKSPYAPPADMLQISKYLAALGHELINKNTPVLNQLSGSACNTAFWDTRIMPWLSSWLVMLYEVHAKIASLKEPFQIALLAAAPLPQHLISATHITTSLDYWDYLVSDVIRETNSPYARMRFFSKKFPHFPQRLGPIRTAVYAFRNLWNNFFDYLTSGTSFKIGLVGGISFIDKLKIYFTIDPLFLFHKKKFSKDGVICRQTPPTTYKNNTKNERMLSFEEIANLLFFKYLPIPLLKQYTPDPQLQLFIGLDIFSQDKNSWTISKLISQKKKWLSHQHGACYGQLKVFSHGEIEYTRKKFLTWGWTKSHSGYSVTLQPLPSPLLSKLPKRKKDHNLILYVSSSRPTFPYRLHTDIMHFQVPRYIEMKKEFFLNLNNDVKNKLLYRPYFSDYETGEIEEIKALGIKTTNQKVDLDQLMVRSSLVVFDHLGTALHKTFTMNVPTITFWNPEHIQIDDSAQSIFTQLQKVGILHSSAIAAAIMINDLQKGNALQEWWNRADVQQAVLDFRSVFCYSDENWRKKWIDMIKAELNE